MVFHSDIKLLVVLNNLTKMKRKGIGAVVGTILIVLISVVAVSIFLGVYLREVKKNTSGDSSLCFGIDLKINNCRIIPISTFQAFGLNEYKPGLLINIERFAGGKDIKNLKFVVTDSSGVIHIEEPVDLPSLRNFGLYISTNYSGFVEYNSVDAVVKNISYSLLVPPSISVSAVVGQSETICAPTREAVRCFN